MRNRKIKKMAEKKIDAIKIVGELTLNGFSIAKAIKEDYIETIARLENIPEKEVKERLDAKITANFNAVKERFKE